MITLNSKIFSENYYTCADCGKGGIKPFDNGDGFVRCDPCATKKYLKDGGSLISISKFRPIRHKIP